jgi:hypothetical protein
MLVVKGRPKKIFLLFFCVGSFPILILSIVSYILHRDLELLYLFLVYFSYFDDALIYYDGAISLKLTSWGSLIIALFLIYYSFVVKTHYVITFIAGIIFLCFIAVLGLGIML